MLSYWKVNIVSLFKVPNVFMMGFWIKSAEIFIPCCTRVFKFPKMGMDGNFIMGIHTIFWKFEYPYAIYHLIHVISSNRLRLIVYDLKFVGAPELEFVAPIPEKNAVLKVFTSKFGR